MKSFSSVTRTVEREANQNRVSVSSIVIPKVSRRRGSSRIIWRKFQTNFSMPYRGGSNSGGIDFGWVTHILNIILVAQFFKLWRTYDVPPMEIIDIFR